MVVSHFSEHGSVGFVLKFGEVLLGEVANWQGVVDTEPVNGLVEDLGAPAGQSTAIDDPGIVIAFALESSSLLVLIEWAFVASQVFDCF